jgi:hypothetical protein
MTDAEGVQGRRHEPPARLGVTACFGRQRYLCVQMVPV